MKIGEIIGLAVIIGGLIFVIYEVIRISKKPGV
jgi:hypothetical protein